MMDFFPGQSLEQPGTEVLAIAGRIKKLVARFQVRQNGLDFFIDLFDRDHFGLTGATAERAGCSDIVGQIADRFWHTMPGRTLGQMPVRRSGRWRFDWLYHR